MKNESMFFVSVIHVKQDPVNRNAALELSSYLGTTTGLAI